MNKKFYVVLFAAFLGMGMSMPSCPGQQALQEQVDKLTSQNADLNKRVMSMDANVKQLDNDMSQVKQLLKPLADTVQAQKGAMELLDANLKEVQTKLAAKAAPKASGKKKR